MQEELAALKQGTGELAALQAQLAAAKEEAAGRGSDSEEVDYLQGQLRRTLRQVVELQRQVRTHALAACARVWLPVCSLGTNTVASLPRWCTVPACWHVPAC